MSEKMDPEITMKEYEKLVEMRTRADIAATILRNDVYVGREILFLILTGEKLPEEKKEK